MTLAQFYTKTIGKTYGNYNGGFVGECVSYVQRLLIDVYGVKPSAWGNAVNYRLGDTGGNHMQANGFTWYAKKSGFKDGDIVVYGTSWGGGYGHIGWVYKGKLISQNYHGHYVSNDPLSTSGMLGYWRKVKKGDDVVKILNNTSWKNRASKTMKMVRGRNMSDAEFKKYAVGASFHSWVNSVEDNKEADNYYALGQWAKVNKSKVTKQIADQKVSVDMLTAQNKDLKAKLAVQSDDTKQLNGLGSALAWFIKRLGLRG